MTFINGIGLPQLGTGAGFALWAFRAIASGCKGCGVLQKGFQHAFADDSAEALCDMTGFVRILGTNGARRITLSEAGCCRVTADELSIIATLSAAQQQDSPLCQAHIHWLMAGKHSDVAFRKARRVSDWFTIVGLPINSPEIKLTRPWKPLNAPILNIVGNA